MIEIKEASTRSAKRQFVEFPDRLYQNHPHYMPALKADERNFINPSVNPSYQVAEAECFLAYRGKEVVGRIMCIFCHTHNDKPGHRQVRFGKVDFIDDDEVANALFRHAEEWARAKNADEILGPLGFCDLDPEGMLVEGFDEETTTITIYNDPYYKDHMERMGYVKDVDWVEYRIKVPRQVDPKIAAIARYVREKQGYRVMHFQNARQVKPWVEQVFHVLTESYLHLYGYIPLTPAQIGAFAKQYLPMMNMHFVKLVLDPQGIVVAVGLAVPSLVKALRKCGGRLFPFGFIYLLQALKKNDVLELYLVGVLPELQGRGINALLMEAMTKEAIDLGYQWTESNPELENNERVQAQWKNYETRQHRRRRIYLKRLNPET